MNDDPAQWPLDASEETSVEPAADEIRELAPGSYAWHGESLSPSLREDRAEPCFELKFLLDEAQTPPLEAWAMQHLHLDPHGNPDLGHAYRTHGLYFDTPQLDVFHRAPKYKRKKYRLRRYGAEDAVFLEQKRKRGDRVAKRRTPVCVADLARLGSQPDALAWVGQWFQQRLAVRKLQPACRISYERKAFFGHSSDGPLRLTLDRHLHCALTQNWEVEDAGDGLPLLNGQVLLELKYRSRLPALFKTLLQDFALTSRPVSKYRLAIQTCHPTAAAGRSVHV